MMAIFCKIIAQNINLKGILAQNSSIVEKKIKNKKKFLKVLTWYSVCQEFKPYSQKISKKFFLAVFVRKSSENGQL